MRFTFRTLEAADVDALLTWRYEPPYDEYDPDRDDVEELHAAVGSTDRFAALDADTEVLAGFLVVRPVDGGVEIGFGLRPDLTGAGHGVGFVTAILDLVRERWAPSEVWLDVLPWNERAAVVYERAGFVRGEVYDRHFPDGAVVTFLRMTLAD